ncbi:MAG: DUF4215 domain-containing protein [Deltaproteobacteria bacterium]|nr:DUF4215 domain-containing protein [Deltaproteobacteria bacterium]
MQSTPDGLVAALPAVAPGTILQYRVHVTLQGGDVLSFPDNAADPFYETFVGEVIPLYCTDFESDPAANGWRNALLEGTDTEGANDWQWGVPAGTPGSGDPTAAYSGARVYGNDLGGGDYNGKYQSDKVTALYAPPIDVGDYAQVHLQYRRWLTVESGNYDQARILSNGTEVWRNFVPATGADVHHEDREWRFHDVDLSSTISTERKVQVQFTLSSDAGLEFGGWTIDDFCIVAIPELPTPTCGDGNVDPNEACDDGNTEDGDGCSADCKVEVPPDPICGNGSIENGEACDDGNQQDGDGCEHDCTQTPSGGPGGPGSDGSSGSDGSGGSGGSSGSDGSDGSGGSDGSSGSGGSGGSDGSGDSNSPGSGTTGNQTNGPDDPDACINADCSSPGPQSSPLPEEGGCSCQLQADPSRSLRGTASRALVLALGFAIWLVRRRRHPIHG